MHLTRGLFSAEEAFARLGQTRDSGCLFVAGQSGAARIFTRDANVVYACSEGKEGESVLETCFVDVEASYVWMPGAQPPKEMMKVNIVGHTLKNAIAKDIHLSKTARVKLDSVDQSTIPPHKKPARYYLIADDKRGEKIALNKGTVIVGRDQSCDIVIPSPQVSRRHCLLQSIVRGLSFRDLESANGVFINGIPARDGFVQSGDRLAFGSYVLSVHREN
jgi:hypothetical protein